MKNQNQRINILARSYCCLLTSVHYSAFVELWYRMVLHFCHFFLRFPISLPAMSLSQAGSSDRMKLFTECAMISRILVSRRFASRFPFSHNEEQSQSVMMVGTPIVSLGPLLRTFRCFGGKVHKCETLNYLPHFAEKSCKYLHPQLPL